MRRLRVILWIIPLVVLILVETIVRIFANLVLVILYPVLKKYWKFIDWAEDWKEFKMADYITEVYNLYW